MALLVTETAAYAPLCDGLSRPTTSTSTFCSTATMERHTDATTRSVTTVRRTDRWPPSSASGRTAASQLPKAGNRGARPPDHARTDAQRAWVAATTSPMRMPMAAPEGPKPAATSASTATMRTPISTRRLTASGW